MAIKVLTGDPGAGKTYYAVYKINELLNGKENCFIISNIEGLNISDSRVLYKDFQAVEFLYTNMETYIKEIREQHFLDNSIPIYLFIDEAQRFFPSLLKDQGILYFFEYHRHLGLEIYIISQHVKKLSAGITAMASEEIRAVNPLINPVPGRFFYKRIIGGVQFGKFTVPIKDKVFQLYKSFEAGDGKQKKSYKFPIIIGSTLLLFVVGLYFGLSSLKNMGQDSDPDPDPSLNSQSNIDPRSDPRFDPDSDPDPGSDLFQSENQIEYPEPTIDFPDDDMDGHLMFEIAHAMQTVHFDEFVEQKKPFLHGYGYFKSDDMILITSRDGNKIYYPSEMVVTPSKPSGGSDSDSVASHDDRRGLRAEGQPEVISGENSGAGKFVPPDQGIETAKVLNELDKLRYMQAVQQRYERAHQ